MLFYAAIYKDAAPSGAKADACSGGARTFSTFLSQEDRCACRFCDWLEGRGKYRQNVSSKSGSLGAAT
jgi:hypothetical protein